MFIFKLHYSFCYLQTSMNQKNGIKQNVKILIYRPATNKSIKNEGVSKMNTPHGSVKYFTLKIKTVFAYVSS